jgi:p21-activated kinase 1
MDDPSSSNDKPARRRGTLTKQPPPSVLSSRPSLRKPQSNTSLQRHPSAPIYPRSHTPTSHSSRDLHQRTKSSAYGSSSSSLEQASSGPSPASNSVNYGVSSTSQHTQNAAPAQGSKDRSTTDNLIGAPFDARGLLSSLEPSLNSNSGYAGPQTSASRRPEPPPLNHTHTSPDLRFHQVRQSQGFNQGGQGVMEITPPRSDNGTVSPKRYSDDASGKPPGPHRKKSGFSSFMNSMLGSPRTIKISAPENPVHMIHVGYDNVTGQFTVRLCASRPMFLPVVFFQKAVLMSPCMEISANTVLRDFPKTGRGCCQKVVYLKKSKSRTRR